MFNQRTRNELIQTFDRTQWDLIVIGGGITGAGILLDASSRGLKCLLVEMNDFASGTSSKSTKLIHGGLRYLKQLQIGIVRDSVKERAIAHRNAAHLVRAEKMLLPIVKEEGFNRLELWAGLSLYDFLGGVKKNDKKKMLNAKETLKHEPLLDQAQIVASGLYTEYRTDDARLVIELIKKARSFGAEAINYCSLTNFNNIDNTIQVKDHVHGDDFKLKAQHYVNATGAWCDDLAIKDSPKHKTKLIISKGSHIVVSKERLNLTQSVYFPTKDGRMIFAVPRQECVYIGTTDLFYKGDKNQLQITKEEVEYLIFNTNLRFPGTNLNIGDIESHWVGIRPLVKPKGENYNPSELSRKDEIFISQSGVIHITGGKLTGYRKMAKKVVDLFSDRECITQSLCIGSETSSPAHCVDHPLYFRYGPIYQDILNRDQNPVLAQLKYCLDFEMVIKPLDFIERRTGDLYFAPRIVKENLNQILNVMNEFLGWDKEEFDTNRNEAIEALECLSLKF